MRQRPKCTELRGQDGARDGEATALLSFAWRAPPGAKRGLGGILSPFSQLGALPGRAASTGGLAGLWPVGGSLGRPRAGGHPKNGPMSLLCGPQGRVRMLTVPEVRGGERPAPQTPQDESKLQQSCVSNSAKPSPQHREERALQAGCRARGCDGEQFPGWARGGVLGLGVRTGCKCPKFLQSD